MASHGTTLCIINRTQNRCVTSVSGVESYDWDGRSRPDVNFEGVAIAPGESVSRHEEINKWANSAWLNMTLSFANGTSITFRIDQYDAYNSISPNPRACGLSGPSAGLYTVTQSVSDRTNYFTVQEGASGQDHPDSDPWMSRIDGGTSLSDISIPGSHDTVSQSWGSMAACQDRSTTAQLNMGVRFIDIRGSVTLSGNEIDLAHGVTPQGGNIVGIFEECQNFLRKYPSETIIMSIKKEKGDEKKFYDIISRDIARFGNLFYTGNAVPRLGDVRGRVVLARRFWSPQASYGLNFYDDWRDNICFDIAYTATSGVPQRFLVQDCYTTGNIPQKLFFIDYGLGRAATSGPGVMSLNFCSCTGGTIPNPKDASNTINTAVYQMLLNAPKGQKLGVVLFDFVNNTLARQVIDKNPVKL